MYGNITSGSYRENNPYLNRSKAELREKIETGWDGIEKDEEKMQILQALSDRICEEQGVKDAPDLVQMPANPGVYGGYNSYSNVIKINLGECKNPYEAEDTVAHEVNHARQGECFKNGSGYDDQTRALLKAQDKEYKDTGPDYDRQLLEQDSNNAGLRFVLDGKEITADDENLKVYLEGRVKYYNDRMTDMQEHPEEIKKLETEQISKAKTNGVLSEKESEEALKACEDMQNPVRQETRGQGQRANDAYRTIIKMEEENQQQNDPDGQAQETQETQSTRDEVLEALEEGELQPGQGTGQAAGAESTRDEVLEALEEGEWQTGQGTGQAAGAESTRDEVLEALEEGEGQTGYAGGTEYAAGYGYAGQEADNTAQAPGADAGRETSQASGADAGQDAGASNDVGL